MKPARAKPPPEFDDKTDVLIVSIKLASGRFHSTIEIPLLEKDEEARKAFIESWFEMMDKGIKVGERK